MENLKNLIEEAKKALKDASNQYDMETLGITEFGSDSKFSRNYENITVSDVLEGLDLWDCLSKEIKEELEKLTNNDDKLEEVETELWQYYKDCIREELDYYIEKANNWFLLQRKILIRVGVDSNEGLDGCDKEEIGTFEQLLNNEISKSFYDTNSGERIDISEGLKDIKKIIEKDYETNDCGKIYKSDKTVELEVETGDGYETVKKSLSYDFNFNDYEKDEEDSY